MHRLPGSKNTATLVANNLPSPLTKSKPLIVSTQILIRSSRYSSTKASLPDYNTSIDVANIKLTKAKAVPKRDWRRKDLDGLSLIDATLSDMEVDTDFQRTVKDLKTLGKERMTLNEKKNRRRALDALGIPDFKDFVAQQAKLSSSSSSAPTVPRLQRAPTEIFQLNIGLYCNQACSHCHVESSPKRREMMTIETADKCLEILARSPEVTTLDITGGAPEMNVAFRHLVKNARKMRPDLDIIDRCNLTVIHEPGQEDLIPFLKEHRVHIIASMPCYSEKNVNMQRGKGVFDRSISALLALNEAGFGNKDFPTHTLDLVYNPLGAFLPPAQGPLEEKYQLELHDQFGISFSNLYTMTNMPVKRFADFLHRRGELNDYMDLLVRNFNLDTTTELMCKNTVSVGWDGKIYDCDFNQQLGRAIGASETDTLFSEKVRNVFDIQSLSELKDEVIAFDNHCYGCTAGMGSS